MPASRPLLKRGDSGSAVTELQERLLDAGFDPGLIDGEFGGGTEAALINFQRSVGLLDDGEAGDRTWSALLAKPSRVAATVAKSTDLAVGDVTSLVTVDIVSAMLPGAPIGNIKKCLPPLLEALREARLADRRMVLMAIASIAAETARFEPIDEGISRFNSSPGGHPFDLYDNRKDLGNKGKPDGTRYKGRGFIQLTGRDNYKRIGNTIGADLEGNPDSANDAVIAARILAAFLKSREQRIKQALIADDLAEARRLVNGGRHGLDNFSRAYRTGEARLPAA
jgi:peptidoglycan L-alanyl-D-glutamate endopeptidase CwlK